ncbi:MAG: type II toxin-antitoxin system VapC family toxin [Coriobacteriales bacterium]|jgi:tRNA(fMet)-specific endonuclease VapC|nr:type II toxin-antitoxin system VapC family toxin [Coriobacteriales bacterium]
MSYFLDTNTCIYFLEGLSENVSLKFQETSPKKIEIPSLVKAELLFGAYNSRRTEANLKRIKAFLRPFEIIPFDDAGADAYARIRAELEKTGTMIGANDAVIAATVVSRTGTLVTNNTREFSRVKDLRIEDWI